MATASAAPSRWDRVGCPVCGGKDIWNFFEATNVPVRDGLLWDSARQAAAAPTGHLRLSVCRTCFYIGNEDDRPDTAGPDRCDFSLQHSPSFRRFVRALAAGLIERYGLKQTTVLDVGSGDGFFLRTICSMGRNAGIGIEPGFVQNTSPDEAVTIIRDRLSAKQAARTRFGLIACRHVLSEIHQPKQLLLSIRRGIRNPACIVYLEVPNAAHTFEHRLFWNLVYEHRSWYLPEGLMNLCLVAGLEVRDIRASWKREYLSAVAMRTVSGSSRRRRRFATASLESLQSFRIEWSRTVEQWQARLAAWRRSGVRVVAWGAGARAVTFFGGFDCRGLIDVVIDINPIRQGKYLPVSALRVEPPSFIRTFKPDVILITNPTYKSEIQAHVARLGVRCAFDQL
jgi:SAM-dependent methyltransferase